MSIQSEINRISGNVQDTLSAIASTGVTVPEGANSDDLPPLTQTLATTKQDKLTGQQGQVVGFDEDGNAVPQAAGVTSFNGRSGAVTPQSGDYTAEQVGAIPQVNGAAGQFLGFTAENVVGPVDAPSGGGGGELRIFEIASNEWNSSNESTISDDFFQSTGYVYFMSPLQMDEYFEPFDSAGIQPYKITQSGQLKIKARGQIPSSVYIVITRFSASSGGGNVYCANNFWVGTNELIREITPTRIFSSLSSTNVIPSGEMLGDVNGDGLFDTEDYTLVLNYVTAGGSLTAEQQARADMNHSGSININDCSIINNLILGKTLPGAASEDLSGNWSINPSYATEEAQFYIDIPFSGLTASSNIVVAIQGPGSEQIVGVEAMAGAFRVYAKLLPIDPLPYKLMQ